jgi:hypothetical protein
MINHLFPRARARFMAAKHNMSIAHPDHTYKSRPVRVVPHFLDLQASRVSSIQPRSLKSTVGTRRRSRQARFEP